MTFDEYQAWNAGSAMYEKDIAVYGLGLAGETGEVVEHIKKALRTGGPYKKDVDLHAMKLELGDVLWYLTAIATHYEIPMAEIANANRTKINKKLEGISNETV